MNRSCVGSGMILYLVIFGRVRRVVGATFRGILHPQHEAGMPARAQTIRAASRGDKAS